MANEQPQRTEISDLGEFKLIDRLTEPFASLNKSTVQGVGDDAAVLDDGGNATVLTNDLFVEGVHFDLMYFPLKHLGYKAVIANLSDVYAMNAKPEQITVSLAISNKFAVEALEEIYFGIRHACTEYNIDLVGGDTTSSLKGLMISVTAVGRAHQKELIFRHGAKESDLICVSGDLGAAFTGLQLLEREKQVFKENPEVQPNLEQKQHIVGRHLKPEARQDIIETFAREGIQPTSLIDVSDGLSSDLFHICEASELGCFIEEKDVPIHPETEEMAGKFNIAPITCALNGGEDYELLFTIPSHQANKIKQELDLTIIGSMVSKDKGYRMEAKGGNIFDLKAQGWDSFQDDQQNGSNGEE